MLNNFCSGVFVVVLTFNDIITTDYINTDCQRQWEKCNQKPVAPSGVKV